MRKSTTWLSIACLLAFLIAPSTARAQQAGTITGTVTDSTTGVPLPGVNVVIAGSQQGASTDAQGRFAISDLEPGTYALLASFVGYATKRVDGISVEAGEATEINIALSRTRLGLDEVVVVGYGTQQRRDLTGAVASVSAEELGSVPVTSFDQALQGHVAGVQVTQASSAPGGGVEIRIRGITSIRGDSQPLYVIDGVPIITSNVTVGGAGTQNIGVASQNPLAGINPNDIASIEVLKDASATAIYGSRGANGVILITTKSGRAERMRLNYNAYYGLQEIANGYELLSAKEYARLVNEARRNDGLAPVFGEDDARFPAPSALGDGTAWQDEIFRTAPVMNQQLSVSGGSEDVQYYVSGNYYDKQGVVLGSRFQRGGIRTNIDVNIGSHLNIGTRLTVSRSVNQLASSGNSSQERNNGVLAGALVFPPTVPVKRKDDTYALNQIPNGVYAGNPVAVAKEITSEQVTDRFIGNAFAEYTITEGLSLKTTLGADIYNAHRSFYAPSFTLFGSFYNGIAQQNSIRNLSWLIENTLTYQHTFGGIHQVDAVAGFTAQQQTNASLEAASNDFASDAFGSDALGLGTQPVNPTSSKRRWSYLSWLGRVNYTLYDRYLLTLTARADGSSKFGANNKWAFFPSAAAAWRLSSERFMQGVDWIDDLKLRVSYGVSGYSGSPYQSLARLTSPYYVLGGALAQGFAPAGIPNPDLRWETTSTFNVGIDAGLLQNRLTLTANYYYKKTEDLLLALPVPPVSGFARALQNAGALQNRGFELAIGVVPVDAQLRWSIDGNISFNRNKVLDLAGRDEFLIGRTLVREGEPLGQWYMLEYDGVFQTPEQFQAGPQQPGAQVGDARYVDQNGDGLINADDRIIVGSAYPDFTYGLTNELLYKGFDLSVLITGAQGVEVFNRTRARLSDIDPATNQIRAIALERWTPDHTDTDVPRATFSGNESRTSSRSLEDGSYLRIRNVTLGYQIPLANSTIREARVYLSVKNALTITDYSGYDPDVDATGGGGIVTSVDDFSYPSARTFTLGINLGF